MRLGVIGNYGATNRGDDAILLAILAAHPNHQFTVFSSHPESTEKQFKLKAAPLFPLGLRSVLKYGFCQSIKALRQVEAVVLGGGGLFQDDRLFACFLWAWQCAWVRWFKKPLFVYAIGVGPLRTRLGRWLTRFALDHADIITVRDEASRDLLRQIGLSEGEIHVTADPAFGLPASKNNRERVKNLYFISLRPWAGHSRELVDTFTEFLLKLKTEKQARFVFVCMQSIRERDQRVLDPLVKRVGGELYVPASFQDLIDRLQTAEFAIGMRYHFLIAALITGTPVLPINYSPKGNALFAGTPLERYALALPETTPGRLTDQLKRLSVDYNNVKIYEKKRAEFLQEAAQKNAEFLNWFIEDLYEKN